MSFFDNTRKPDGLGGKLMVSLMNVGHRSLAHWGMQFLPLSPEARVLKPGGVFFLCNECSGDTDKNEKWTERIKGMTIYRDVQLQAALEQAGFHDIEIHKNEKDWLCMLARK